MPIGDGRGKAEILLDQKKVKPFCFKVADHVADLLDDDRGQPLGRLVEQQQPGAGAQDAADRQHLLLAARELGALAAPALQEVGEDRVDLVDAHAARLHHRRQQQVLLDVRLAKMPRSSGQ